MPLANDSIRYNPLPAQEAHLVTRNVQLGFHLPLFDHFIQIQDTSIVLVFPMTPQMALSAISLFPYSFPYFFFPPVPILSSCSCLPCPLILTCFISPSQGHPSLPPCQSLTLCQTSVVIWMVACLLKTQQLTSQINKRMPKLSFQVQVTSFRMMFLFPNFMTLFL